MGFFNNKKDSSERVKVQSFSEWAAQNKQLTSSHLLNEGINFINDQAELLKSPVSHLILDDRWHYLDKPTKKQSYRGKLETNSQGVPYLWLTYFTFRHGSLSIRFDSKEALKALWKQSRDGQVRPENKLTNFISRIKPVAKPIITDKIEALIPIDYVALDLATWPAMTPIGVNHYLKRKGLSNLPIPGIRFGKNHIATRIIDTENNAFGLQKIFNDGQKRFTKGLEKKGHFALIGTDFMPDKLTTIHICEGVATAATIFLATGEPVFSALDAFNLLPVSRALKRHYPKNPITIWADNDWQKANKKNPQGRVIGNTGLIQANRTAFKLRNAAVCTPDFSSFEPDAVKLATDFNDLYQVDSLAAVIKTTPKKPDIALALWHELIQYNKRAHGVISPSQFASGKKITYNSRYLPNDIFQSEGIHLVRSAIGTGKTAVVEGLVKQHPEKSVLFTTHLISLVESGASRLSLTSYNECDNFDLQMEHRLAICLNSLGKLTAEGTLRHYDVVIIDEIEQVLARLTTKIEQKPLVFSVLQHVMNNAKTLICLDAHLSQTTIQLIQNVCDKKPVTVHFNAFEAGLNRAIALHDSGESVQLTAMRELEHKKTVYLAFNSKKEAFKTFSTIAAAFPEKKGLYISSDNTGDAENRAFFNDVNDQSTRYDYLVCTPSVSTGVSIDNGHFDFVGGVFNAQVNTANDCMQALGRVRNHQTLHVFCEKRQGNKPLNPDVIAAKWSNTHHHDMALMNLDDAGNRVLMNPDYERLNLLVTQARHVSYNDFYQQFALLALHDGMGLTYFGEELLKETQKELRQFKNACVSMDRERLSQESLSLTRAELQALVNKPRKTMSESRQYKKQQLIEFYNLNEHDPDTIQALAALDNDGRFKKQVLALELALGDEEVAKKRFLAQLESGEQFAADLTHFATLQQLYQQLLKTLHLAGYQDRLSLEDYYYTQEAIVESGFLRWIDDNRRVLQGVITIPTLNHLNRDPLRFISMLLAKLGLKQKRVGRAERGVYHLDNERTQMLNALMHRRKLGLAGVSVPLDMSNCPVKRTTSTDFFSECLQKIKRFFTPCPLEPVLI